MKKLTPPQKDIGLTNRFTWHTNAGDFAEKYLRKNYFSKLGLKFRKIREDKEGEKPDGYILNRNNQKIALAEIKLIESKVRKLGITQSIKTDETICRAIRKAKKQLKTIDDNLPKIIYLIGDDIFVKPEIVKIAIFGKLQIVMRTINGKRQTIFEGHSGFYEKLKEDNKMYDNLISAIVCYKPTLSGYKLYTFRNKGSVPLPNILLDKRHIVEMWDYSSNASRISLKKIK